MDDFQSQCCPHPSNSVIVPDTQTSFYRKLLLWIFYGEILVTIMTGILYGVLYGIMHLLSVWIDYLGYATMHYCQVMIIGFSSLIEIIFASMRWKEVRRELQADQMKMTIFWIIFGFNVVRMIVAFLAYGLFKRVFNQQSPPNEFGRSPSLWARQDGYQRANQYQSTTTQNVTQQHHGGFQGSGVTVGQTAGAATVSAPNQQQIDERKRKQEQLLQQHRARILGQQQQNSDANKSESQFQQTTEERDREVLRIKQETMDRQAEQARISKEQQEKAVKAKEELIRKAQEQAKINQQQKELEVKTREDLQNQEIEMKRIYNQQMDLLSQRKQQVQEEQQRLKQHQKQQFQIPYRNKEDEVQILYNQQEQRYAILKQQSNEQFSKLLNEKEEKQKLLAEQQKLNSQQEQIYLESKMREDAEDLELSIRKKAEVELKRSQFIEEPAQNDPNVTLITFRTPGGQRITRRFLKQTSVAVLYDYVRVMYPSEQLGFEKNDSDFQLLVPIPRRVYDKLDETLEQAKLYPSALITIKELN